MGIIARLARCFTLWFVISDTSYIGLKDRQHNDQNKKYKRTNNDLQNITYKTKDRDTRTPSNTGGELRFSERLSSPCSTSGTHRIKKSGPCVLIFNTVEDTHRHENVSRDFQRQRRTSLKVFYHYKRCKLCSLLLNYTTIYKHITSYKLDNTMPKIKSTKEQTTI
jgi:hypothetical protein